MPKAIHEASRVELTAGGMERAHCQAGRHVFDLREEKRMGQGGALFTRKVYVCKHCGYAEASGWIPLSQGG